MGRKTQHADGSGGRRSKLAAKGKLREQLIEELLARKLSEVITTSSDANYLQNAHIVILHLWKSIKVCLSS